MAQYTWPLITQLIGIIDRDYLTYLSPFGFSEPFRQYDTVQLWPQAWPALLVYEANDALVPPSEHTIEQAISIQCRVQLSETDRNICAQKLRGYLGALANLFIHYDFEQHAADLVSPVPIPPSLSMLGTTTQGVTANVTRIFPQRLTFDEFGQVPNGFRVRGTCHLIVQMEEVL
jgi:hypothetical protein